MRAGDYQLFSGGSSPGTDRSAAGVTARFTITASKELPE